MSIQVYIFNALQKKLTMKISFFKSIWDEKQFFFFDNFERQIFVFNLQQEMLDECRFRTLSIVVVTSGKMMIKENHIIFIRPREIFLGFHSFRFFDIFCLTFIFAI